MYLRWLLPLLAAVALVGSSVSAWASAGWIDDAHCCCPVKAKCKCHHDEHDGTAKLKRCGDTARWAAVASTMAVPVATGIDFAMPRAVCVVPNEEPAIPDDIPLVPETPPF